jgi:hypothetical protein
MHLLHTDDEDNAVIALRIILDLHKTYRAQRPHPGPLEPDVQPFLDFVKQVIIIIVLTTALPPDFISIAHA